MEAKYLKYIDCVRDLIGQDYKDLGWLNNGIKLPDISFNEIFCSQLGKSVHVNDEQKLFYSIDSGD